MIQAAAEEVVDGLSLADRNKLVEDNMRLVGMIASRLNKRYYWVPIDECYSYARWGLVIAARQYDPVRRLKFSSFAYSKAFFAAVDQMRKERIVVRKGVPSLSFESLTKENLSSHTYEGETQIEAQDLFKTLLEMVSYRDCCLLVMRYVESKTFKEIAVVLRVCESHVNYIHAKLIDQFRRRLDCGKLARKVGRRKIESRD